MKRVWRPVTQSLLLGLVVLVRAPAEAQTYPEIERRWTQGERRELITPLRNIIPSVSGMTKARARFMLGYALCTGNVLDERTEGRDVASSISTTPRPPWTIAAAERIQQLKNWCNRPIIKAGGTTQVLVITDSWKAMPAQDRANALLNITAFQNTRLGDRLGDSGSGVLFRSAVPSRDRRLGCEEQVRIAENGGEASEQTHILCIRGLWTGTNEVIFWPDVELPADWDTESFALMPEEVP
jgi:hypothetical protein